MKILYSLSRLRPQMEVATALLAVEIAVEFAVQNPVPLDLIQWGEKRKTGDSIIKLQNRLKELQQIGFIEFGRSGKSFLITRGDSFASIYHNNPNATVTETVKEERVKKDPEPPLEVRYKKFRDEVMTYSEKYPEKMLHEFIAYWTEHKAGKMKWEMDFFSIGRRLGTWKSNQDRRAAEAKNW